MKIYTPEISWHNRDPIFSVDIQNKLFPQSESSDSPSYRLATCGNDTHVIIWKAELTRSGQSGAFKLVNLDCLVDLTRHERSVNVVRFSPDVSVDMLAAGDDSNVIIIWKRFEDQMEINEVSPNKSFNQNQLKSPSNKVQDENINKNNIQEDEQPKIILNGFEPEVIAKENWHPIKVLRGHLQDVSDLYWSPDGLKLISGSVDNSAIVWDVFKGTKLHIFNEHKGFVQGVAWDPLNKYLATVSHDRDLRLINVQTKKTVYRVNKMQTENNKTTRLFYDDTLRSFCRRLTFAPNGEFLVVPAGILEIHDDNKTEGEADDELKYINTTYIFERRSLNKPSFYLPSTKYTVAVRCCPKLFQLREDLESNDFGLPYRIIFAVATQDSVMFYDSQQELPFAQVSQIHYCRLTDITWSPDGRLLVVSSSDGFATYIRFDENEFGLPYDGPVFQEPEETPVVESKSPEFTKIKVKKDNNTPNSKETEVLSKKLADSKLISTPPITKFFTKKEAQPKVEQNDQVEQMDVDGSNKDLKENQVKKDEVVTAEKVLMNGNSNESNMKSDNDKPEQGIKRKEIIDLTGDSQSPCKKPVNQAINSQLNNKSPNSTGPKAPRRIQFTTLPRK